jgi:hypothetical protein
VLLKCLVCRRGCLWAPFIAPRSLGVVAFSIRELKNFPIYGLTGQSVCHLNSGKQRSSIDLIGQFPFPMWHRIVRCATGQLPHQLGVGGWCPLVDRTVGEDVRCTGQCIVHCLVNFINKINESSVFGRTHHRAYLPDRPVHSGQSSGSQTAKLLQLLFTLLERFPST